MSAPGAELREGMAVTLAVEGASAGVACRVVGFHRGLIVLDRTAGARRDGVAPGIDSYVIVGPAALRVQVVRVTGARVVLRLLDRFSLQQRQFSRLAAEWPIVLEGAGGPLRTRTVDVSAGGVLVRVAVAIPAGSEVRARLQLPDGRAPLEATARVVRASREGVALRFVDVSTADEARVAEVVLEALGAGEPVRSA